MCALGAGDSLVGRSHECDNPAWVLDLPQCSEPAFDITVASREIDSEVTRRIRSGQPLYRIHNELIRELAPDLIISQAHCEVCAVTPENLKASGCDTPAAQVLALTAGTLDGIFDGIRQIARALRRQDEGRALIHREQERLDAVRRRTAGLRRPSVVMIEWTDPIFPMGNWGPELVDIANGNLLLGNRGQHSYAVGAEQLRTADPEYLIVAPCGFNLKRALQDQPILEGYPWWTELQAVRSGKVAFADGNLFFNRSGMTVAHTAEIIAEILHGVAFEAPTEGTHWQWLKPRL